MKNLKELEKEGKKTLKKREESTREEHKKKAKRLVEMIAQKEGVDFQELWSIFGRLELFGHRNYCESNRVCFSIPEYAPIEYWLDQGAWCVYTAIPQYYVEVSNLREALALAKDAYKEQP